MGQHQSKQTSILGEEATQVVSINNNNHRRIVVVERRQEEDSLPVLRASLQGSVFQELPVEILDMIFEYCDDQRWDDAICLDHT